MTEPDVPDPSPPEVEAGRLRVFPCDSCGADLEFAIDVQSLRCPYCGHRQSIEHAAGAAVTERDLRAALEAQAEERAHGRGTMAGVREVACRDCGATVQFHGPLTSQDCPYCGTPIQLDEVHDAADRLPVDGVLPFRIPRDAADERLRAWVKSRWFAPNEFQERGVRGKFAGVYMPYWTYDAETFNRYRGERGEHYWITVRQGDREVRQRRTRWYPVSGAFDRFFDDVLVVAGKGLPLKRVNALTPWPLHDCIPFTQAVLAGFFARTYEVSLADGLKQAKQEIAAALHRDVCQRIGGDEQRVHAIDTEYGDMTYKHLLLPVWMLAYRFRGKAYQVVVNAATGEVQGDRPYSWVKITLFVLMWVVIVGGIVAFVQMRR
ncbi:MAG: hypothetical protein H6837_05460 [Planctomycetes bacterium]|nr:hypothetical protein [Planctomycetota bacterium]